MATKRELTIEELQAQYDAIKAELEARKKAEAEERNARLKAEREQRYMEVVRAYENFEELRSKFVEDYGYFTFETTGQTRNTINRTPSIWDFLL